MVDLRPVITDLKARVLQIERAIKAMQELQERHPENYKQAVTPPQAGSRMLYTDGRGNFSSCRTLTCVIEATRQVHDVEHGNDFPCPMCMKKWAEAYKE